MVLKMVVSSYKFVFIQVALVISVTIIQCAKQPHLLFILADDYGWNDIGYHGSEIKTPNLDALAAEGVKLENYYVQPICTPSRSQLMSGRYHIYTGLQHNTINAAQPNGLPLEMPTLANKLKDVGYSTHMVGKWHLGFYKKEYLPTYRGFDSFYGYLTGNEDYYTHTACVITNCGLDFHNNTVNVWTENGTYSAMDFTRKAEEIAANHDPDKPLFLYLPYQSVHAPLEAPQKYIDKHKNIQSMERRKYAGMVSVLDEAVKNVTDAFKKYGLWDNTVMIFSTDNGGPTENAANNWPLRGEKFTLWEGGVHGVGFVNSPLLQMTKYTNKQFIHVSDWYPTLVHLAGGSTKGIKLDGFDQWETINMNQQSPRKELLHNIDLLYPPIGKRLYQDSYDNRFRAAIRVGDMKLLTGSVGEDRWTPPPHLEGHIFQPLYFKDDTKNVWLFNITADPTEHHDLSESHPQIVKQLLDRLAYYNSTAVPCRYPGNDPKSYPHLHGGAWVPWRD